MSTKVKGIHLPRKDRVSYRSFATQVDGKVTIDREASAKQAKRLCRYTPQQWINTTMPILRVALDLTQVGGVGYLTTLKDRADLPKPTMVGLIQTNGVDKASIVVSLIFDANCVTAKALAFYESKLVYQVESMLVTLDHYASIINQAAYRIFEAAHAPIHIEEPVSTPANESTPGAPVAP